MKRAGVEFTGEAATNLEWALISDDEISADLVKVRAGKRQQVLEYCLTGAEDPDTIAGWHEYVEALALAVASEAS